MLPRLRALVAVAAVLCAAASLQAGQARPNVVLFFIDTLRADHLGCYGYERETSPSIDEFAGRGTLFEQAVAQSSWSLPSFSSIFTSLYPHAHNVDEQHQLLPDSLPRLARTMKTFGYATAGFVGGSHLSSVFGMSTGFDTYRDRPHFGSLFHTVPPALGWLDEKGDGPFFLLVHGYDTHIPYDVPAGFAEMYAAGYDGPVHRLGMLNFQSAKQIAGNVFHFGDAEAGDPQALPAPDSEDDVVPLGAEVRAVALTEADRAHIVAHYDGAISYADTWFGYFLEQLEARGLLDDTLVVLASDHGEALGEQGYYRHRWDLYDSQIHVPLVIGGPGVARGRRVPQVVELIDLAPTLLELCGIPRDERHQGRSLAPAAASGKEPPPAGDDRVAFSAITGWVSARQGRWHLVRSAGGETRLFDLELDPDELSEVSAQHPEVTAPLLSRLQDWYETFRQETRSATVRLSREEDEMFRQSGYW